MITPVTKTVAQALAFSKTSSDPIIVKDTNTNIAQNADALVALGAQIVWLQGDGSYFPLEPGMNIKDALALSSKTYYMGNLINFQSITDTAANAAANINTLESLPSHIYLVVNDTATNVINNSSALQSLAATLAKKTYGDNVIQENNNFFSINISDTATNVINNSSAIQSLESALANDTYGFGNFNNNHLSINISDTATNIADNSDALKGLIPANCGLVDFALKIKIDDSASNIANKWIELNNLASVLANTYSSDVYGNTYYNSGINISITDTATNVLNNSNALAGLLEGLNNDYYEINDHMGFFYSNLFSNNNSFAIQIIDTASNIVNNAAQLKGLSWGLYLLTFYGEQSGHPTANNLLKISINDTASNVINNSSAIQLLVDTQGSYPDEFGNTGLFVDDLTLNINDTATNIINNTLALQSLATHFRMSGSYYDVGRLHFTLNISDTAFNVINHINDFAYITDDYNLSITDNAYNIATSLDSLQANVGKISAITLSDAGTPTLAISAGQLANDAAVLGKMGGNYNLSVSGVTTANLASVLANSHVIAVSIVDSAGNVSAGLDSLQANVNKITGISLTDVSKPTISISALQATNDAAILAKISSAYTLSVASSGVTVANLATAWANNQNKPVLVTDSAKNVASSLDSLQTNIAKFSNIALTDTGTPAIALTASQFVKDASVLGKISSAYNLNISGETVANVAKDVLNSHVSSIAIKDSAANVLAKLDAVLLPNVAKISGMSLTDTSTPTLALTGSQFALDSAVLSKISSAYNLTVSGELAANIATDVQHSHVSSIAIKDSAANVLAKLDAVLLPNVAKISGITLTDTSTPTLNVTASQFKNDSAVLSKISSAYNLSISGELAANVATDIKNTHVKSVGVVDTATHVASSLAALQSNVSKLSGIAFTDSVSPTLSLSASQVKADLGVLNIINSPYVLSVKDSVANINKLALDGLHTGQVEIMPTSLLATLKVNTLVSYLNLSLINLSGCSITEKAYQGTGTEVDIVASNGVVKNTLLFTHDTVDQLHLLGIGNAVVHGV